MRNPEDRTKCENCGHSIMAYSFIFGRIPMEHREHLSRNHDDNCKCKKPEKKGDKEGRTIIT